jgi:hypothetical protein
VVEAGLSITPIETPYGLLLKLREFWKSASPPAVRDPKASSPYTKLVVPKVTAKCLDILPSPADRER